MPDTFQEVEQEFFRLRGLFAVGHITAQEYDEALRQLQVRDAEGRVWMIGANSGRWYYSDSPQWVEGDPIHDPQTSAEQLVFSNRPAPGEQDSNIPSPKSYIVPTPADPVPDPAKAPGSTRQLALAFFGIGMVFLLVALGFFILVAPNSNLFAGSSPLATPTRILPSAAQVAQNTGPTPPPPVRTNTLTPVTTATTPIAATSSSVIPLTVTPTRGLVIEPTSTEPALTVIPTVTPNAGANSLPDANPNDNESSVPGLANLPPAVYITNIRVSPNPPARNDTVTFTASFYNTNREDIGMYWRIVLLDPNRQGRNKDYGESPAIGITVPPGRTDFSVAFVPVTASGPCLTLQALAARRRDDNSRDYLLATGGGPFITNFTFC